MNGVYLKKLPADDMLDVIHALFEEDASGSTREQFEMRARFREIIYHDFYGTEYPFKLAKNEGVNNRNARLDGPMNDAGPGLSAPGAPIPTPGGMSSALGADRAAPIPVPTGAVMRRPPAPVQSRDGLAHKPYIPPTDLDISGNPFKPFTGLDAPMF